jgi:NlpC/P60 family
MVVTPPRLFPDGGFAEPISPGCSEPEPRLNVVSPRNDVHVSPPAVKEYNGQAAAELSRRLSKMAIKFQTGGGSPEMGMDSSGFVGYVLHRQGLLDSGWRNKYYSGNLPGFLLKHGGRPVTLETLRVGDLIFVSNFIYVYLGNGSAIGMTGGGIHQSDVPIETIDVNTDIEPSYEGCKEQMLRLPVRERIRCDIIFIRP